MVHSVVCGRQINKDGSCYQPFLKPIFNVLCEIQKLACCGFARLESSLLGMMAGSTTGANLLRIRRSNSFYGWHSREIGRKLFAFDGSLPGLRRAMILVFLQIFGMFLVSMQLFISSRIHFRVRGPKCLISSVQMLSRPIALPVLRALMLILSSSRENGSVSLVVWEYWSHSYHLSRLFGGGFPIEQQLICNLVGGGGVLLLCWS